MPDQAYYEQHKVCPNCHDTRFQQTTLGYFTTAERDNNNVRCSCGWVGRVHHLVPEPPPKTLPPRVYLGDSVYARFDGFHVVLTTDNGEGPSNTICLEPNVLCALELFVKKFKKEIS